MLIIVLYMLEAGEEALVVVATNGCTKLYVVQCPEF